jgi:ribosome maturation protein Sdo1
MYFSMKRRRDALIARLEDNVSPKERTSLLKLVLGMARKNFNHKVDSPHTVARIEKALGAANLPVSNDVIRKYLAEADEKFAE